MNQKAQKLVALAIMIFTCCCTAFAQQTQYPRAVLVQLRAERNRIEALTKQRRYKEVEIVKTDAKLISDAMIKDFHDYFRYCPVYYYMDTNLNQVLKQQFDGILLDEHYNPVSNAVVHPSDTDYLIAFYGVPVAQSHGTRTVRDSSKYLVNSGEPMGRGLIINNYKMQQVHYFYKLDFGGFFWTKKNKKRYNVVISDHYDMEYFPFAKSLQKLLKAGWGNAYRNDDSYYIDHEPHQD